ncbi:PE domain-containing protein [Mycolicibacterium goodii]|nr:PE domain-containing protein [Mycolicibacterium goodii]
MVASFDADPDGLRSGAARIESIRAAMNPEALPVGFEPAGSDAVSALAASRISARAAETVNGLWSTWRALGKVAENLKATADGYETQDSDSAAMLSGGSSGPGSVRVRPVSMSDGTPVATPVVYTGAPASSPEELAAQIHSGAGASSPETFAQQWSTHAAAVESAASDLADVQNGLSSSWSGTAHDGAHGTIRAAHADMVSHGTSMSEVSNFASTHAANFRTATSPGSGVPHPAQFAVWNENLNNAVAAESQYPGAYTAAVIEAQEQLGQGYAQAGQAYGQYAIDPVTGELIDPATGEVIDPATGQPVGDVADAAVEAPGEDADQMLSTGGQLLAGLLGGAVGAVGAAVGAVAQGGQQMAQMATQGVSQLAKGLSQSSEPSVGDIDLSGGELGGGDFGAGGGVGGGGGGGDTAPAAIVGSPVGTAATPPTPTTQPAAGGAARPSGPSLPMGAGMGGAPFMPMGGAGAPGSNSKPEASPDGKKFVAPQRANTQRVIGESDSERLSAKRERRAQRMAEAKASAAAADQEEGRSQQ